MVSLVSWPRSPRGKKTDTNWVGGSVGLRTGVDVFGEEKNPAVPGVEPRSSNHHSLYICFALPRKLGVEITLYACILGVGYQILIYLIYCLFNDPLENSD
jgi:hypothetical protein